MEHALPVLPFSMDALAPVISRETIDYHYGRHHAAYAANLNKLITGTEFENLTLEEIIRKAPAGGIFNNAAQVWNHSFYWQCLTPEAGGDPSGALAEAIKKEFASFAKFKEQFSKTAVGTFGSGWVWLVKGKDGKLAVESTSNAATPLTEGKKPLLTCDVWEHAYYIDYRNNRAGYVEAFWRVVNWTFVENNFM
jgi:Fe-Mn family superoxide dismutase